MLAVGWTCEIRVCIRVMRRGRLGTIDGADRLAILPLDACHVQTAGTEILYLRALLERLGIAQKAPTPVYEDNAFNALNEPSTLTSASTLLMK